MTAVADEGETGPRDILRCAECRAPLAPDQRYCVECGARRGGLPQAIADRIEAILARGDASALAAPVPAAAVAGPGGAAAAAVGAAGRWRSMPSPRALAVATMSMLAFGVVLASLVSPDAQSAGTPVVLVVSPAPTSASPHAVVPPTPSPTSPPSSSSPSSVAPSSASSTPSSSPSSGGGSSSSSGGGTGNGGSSSSTPSFLPPVKHVFVVMLSDQRYDESFGTPAGDPYLAKTLRKRGELFPNYYAVAQGDLANEIALVSGQGPTPQTEANCPRFAPVSPGVAGPKGQVLGSGCVYPSSTLTLADQLTAKGDTWRAYVEGIGNGPHGQAKTCRHPALGSTDPGQPASLHDPYVTWSNPFVYFESIGKSACAKNDVGLGQLAKDLKTVKTTPSFSYIVPSPCDDGNPQSCAPGARSGLAAADRFLQGVIPEIEASPAYQADGLIAITFDQAPQSGPYADASSCCDNPTQYPNLPPTTTTTTTTPTTTAPASAAVLSPSTSPVPYAIAPPPSTTTPVAAAPPTPTPPATTTPAPTPPTPASEQAGQTAPTGGGGEVGLLVLSRYVKPNSTDTLDYFNHYSLLSSIEQLFGLGRLGYARDAALPALGKPQYNHYKAP